MSSRPPPPPPTTAAASRIDLGGGEAARHRLLGDQGDQRRPCSPSAPPSTTAEAPPSFDWTRLARSSSSFGSAGPALAPTAATTTLDRRRGQPPAPANRVGFLAERSPLRLLGAGAGLLQLLRRSAGAADRVLRVAEQLAGLAQLGLALAEPVDRGGPGDRLDPAHVGGARALGGDLEDADLGGVGDVGAAAELTRDAVDLDHPHPLAVFLAEQGHRAQLLGLGALHVQPAHRAARLDPLVDPVLDVAQLLGAERLAVGEVEAQLVGTDGGAGLAHVGAEPLAQGRVQQVGRGVVAHRRVAGLAVDDGLDRPSGSIAAPLGSTSSAWSSPSR